MLVYLFCVRGQIKKNIMVHTDDYSPAKFKAVFKCRLPRANAI